MIGEDRSVTFGIKEERFIRHRWAPEFMNESFKSMAGHLEQGTFDARITGCAGEPYGAGIGTFCLDSQILQESTKFQYGDNKLL